jgi:hypothetical protein
LIGDVLDALAAGQEEGPAFDAVRAGVTDLCRRFPIYPVA